jgi:hypothetical protein
VVVDEERFVEPVVLGGGGHRQTPVAEAAAALAHEPASRFALLAHAR